jgi:hypothetical protein
LHYVGFLCCAFNYKVEFPNYGWIWTWNQNLKTRKKLKFKIKEMEKLTCSRYLSQNHTWRPKYFPPRSSCTNACGVTASAMWARSTRDRNVRMIWSSDWRVGHLGQLRPLQNGRPIFSSMDPRAAHNNMGAFSGK